MGNRLSKIYTRTGDDGTTGLGDGSRVPKDDPRVEAYGCVDECNSAIGLVLAVPGMPPAVRERLTAIQHELFDLGGELCIPGHRAIEARHVGQDDPPGVAGQALGQRHELPAPPLDRAEIAGERARHPLGRRPAIAAETREIELVEHRGVEQRRLLLFQSPPRRRRRVEPRQLVGDGVQPADRRAINMLIVALDQARRDAVQCPGTTGQRGDAVLHGDGPFRDGRERGEGRDADGKAPGGSG